MNLNKLFKQLFAVAILLVSNFCLIPQVFAAGTDGTCQTSTGSPNLYSFDFNSTMTDPTQNIAGNIIMNAAGGNWNVPVSVYTVVCSCNTMNAAFVTATAPPGAVVHSDGNLRFYKINDFLAVSAEVYIAGNLRTYVPAPFNSVSNQNTGNSNTIACSDPKNIFSTGSSGRINLYFVRPFVGEVAIPPTEITRIYLSSMSGITSPNPVAIVNMAGNVIVPQNCEIGPDASIEVDFGDISSAKFKTKGAMPDGFSPVRKQITLKCRNIDDGVKVNLTFQGVPDPSDPTALATTNSSVAVKITDAGGAVIAPNTGHLPVDINYSPQDQQVGNTSIDVYPINTTGEPSAVGEFNATATIRAEIE